MKMQQILMFIFMAAAMGWAMAEGTGDTSVGIALGVGIAAALSGGMARRSCGRAREE